MIILMSLTVVSEIFSLLLLLLLIIIIIIIIIIMFQKYELDIFFIFKSFFYYKELKDSSWFGVFDVNDIKDDRCNYFTKF